MTLRRASGRNVSKSERDRIAPHRVALLAGFFLAGASVIFGIVAIGIMLSGNTAFEVVEYGLGIENRYFRVLISPFIAFIGGYLFAYTVSKGAQLLSSRHEEKD